MANANLSTLSTEVLYTPTPNVSIQGVTSEVLYIPQSANVSIQGITFEVLLKFPVNNRRRPVYVASSS